MATSPPDAAKLYEAALIHISRYATTEASLTRALSRKIDSWARKQPEADPEHLTQAARAAKSQIPAILTRLKSEKILDDSAFATSRAKRLTREGKSRRFTLAHLSAKGVAPETAAATLSEDPDRELAAACAFLRRRRAGPFGEAPELKILAAMARTGFTQETARHALRLTREEAESRIKSLHA